MTCDDCERNREMGRKFCTTCGVPLDMGFEQPDPDMSNGIRCIEDAPDDPEDCPECERNRILGRKFCTTCGKQLAEYVPDYDEPILKIEKGWAVATPSMVVLAIAMIFSLVCMFIYIGDVWRYVYDINISIYVFFIVEIDLGVITGQLAQFYWLFIAVILLASCMLVLWFSRSALSGFRSPGYSIRLGKTPLYQLALFFGATLVVEVAITVILSGLGVDISTPEIMQKFTPVEYAFYMGRAAVWEEIAFRLVPIGLPMLIIAIVMRRKDCLKWLFGGFGMSRAAFVLLVVSSIVFAYAHVDGWGAWKMITIMISAFTMGYLFIRFGIYVSIVFHFITDYTAVWMVVDQTIGSILELAILGLGVICIPLAVKKMVEGCGALKTAPNISFGQDSNESKKN